MPSIKYKNILYIAVIAIIYLVAGKFSLVFAFSNASASAFWIPTAISISSFLILGYKVWPAIYIGSFFVNYTTAGTFLTSLGIASGNTLEGITALYLINNFMDKEKLFNNTMNIFKYSFFAGLLSTLVSAVIGTTTLSIGGFISSQNHLSILFTWWVGDMGSAIIIAPVILLWKEKSNINWNSLKIIEASILFILLVLTSIVIFLPELININLPLIINRYPFPLLTFPIILAASFRFDLRETATAIFVYYVIAGIGIYEGSPRMATGNMDLSFINLQIFVIIIFLLKMSVSSAVHYRKILEAQMESAIKIKETLMKEIYHRVKNNLQIVSSLLNLQSNYINENNLETVLKESRNRINSMALIHEKLYQTEAFEKMNIKDYFYELINTLCKSYNTNGKNIKLFLDVEDINLEVEKIISLGLILNELISNAFKHAFKEIGNDFKILINLKLSDENIYLEVSNNGREFPMHIDIKNTDTLGLQLVNSLTTQLKGNLELIRNGETTFMINFNK